MQRNSPERRQMLTARRLKQRNAVVGFTPMPNAQFNASCASALIDVMVERSHLDVREAQQEAVRRAAKRLGHAPMVRAYRVKPSRSDDSNWRNGTRGESLA